VSTEAVSVGVPERRPLVARLSQRWHLVGLTAVLAVAAFLDFFRLEQNGYANEYYAGAVRSMLKSWHNFFFVSFDPGGLVSVDKPPLALWLEATSAKIFGYSGWSILLPEALAGVAAVWLLYLLVARVFGRVAGLVAALALAVSPVSVSVNRDNNPDALLALLLIAAAYVGVRAVESGRLRTLLLSAVLVGLAFNTKMLAAMVVVPGLGLTYLLFSRLSWRRRLAHLAVAGVVLVAVSGAWVAAVDLTPASQRPYVGSTSDNSALSLAFDYNGLGRVTGQTGGTSFGGGGGLGGAFSGTPGWLRLLNDALGDQGAWLLPLAILGGISALVAAVRLRRRRELAALTVIGGWFVAAAVVFSFSSGIIHTYYLSALAPATSALVGIGAVALWLAASPAKPATPGRQTGAPAAPLGRDTRRHPLWLGLPLLALALSAWLEVDLLRRSDYLPWLQPLVIAGCAAAAVALVVARLPRVPGRLVAGGAIGIALLALLAAPTAWAATTFRAPVNGVFPGAGPSFVSGLGTGTGNGGFTFGGGRGGGPPAGMRFRGNGGPPSGGFRTLGPGAPPAGFRNGAFPPQGYFLGRGRGGFGGGDSASIERALTYAKAHDPGTRWTLIVSSEQAAAPYVIKGESVAAMGGFTGRETVLTSSYLSSLVRSGQARYFLLGSGGAGFGPFGGNNQAVSTITSVCKKVSYGAGTTSTSSLYDCAGKAAAIAAQG
jgi:4-amino-4-deoxy-L-arabinose transferase-like glycosyltransferase